MKWDTALRGIGVLGIVGAYFIYQRDPTMGEYALTVTFTAIIALVSPEMIDRLPFGPAK